MTEVREKELVYVRNINLINALTYISWFLMPFLVILFCMITVSFDLDYIHEDPVKRSNSIGGSKVGGARDAPLGSKFFQIHAVFGK